MHKWIFKTKFRYLSCFVILQSFNMNTVSNWTLMKNDGT